MKAKDIADLVDAYVAKRKERLELQHDVDSLKDEENAMKTDILNYLKEKEIGVIGGRSFQATLKTAVVPMVTDWDALYAYVRETGDFSLIYRQIKASSVSEQLEAGVELPGIGTVTVQDLSITMIKK